MHGSMRLLVLGEAGKEAEMGRAGTTYLSTSSMPQITPINLPPQMIPGMHHLMRQSILQMSLVPHLIRAYEDSVVGRETTALTDFAFNHLCCAVFFGFWNFDDPCRAALAVNIGCIQVSVEVANLAIQEANDGTVLKQIISPLLGVLYVAGFVSYVCVFTESFLSLARHLVRQDIIIIRPSCRRVVTGL